MADQSIPELLRTGERALVALRSRATRTRRERDGQLATIRWAQGQASEGKLPLSAAEELVRCALDFAARSASAGPPS